MQLHDFLADKPSFVMLRSAAEHRNQIARAVARPQFFCASAGIVAYHVIRRVKNVLGRTVVFLQFDYPSLLELVLKAENIRYIRAAEFVYALVVVAHYAEVSVLARKKADKPVLRMVCVLVLINQYVSEFVSVVVKHIRVFLEQPYRAKYEVVKIERVVVLHFLAVELVNFADNRLKEVAAENLGIIVRRNQLVFCAAYLRRNRFGRVLLGVKIKLLQALLDNRLLVGCVKDYKAARVAYFVNVAAQNFHARGMEG